MNRKISATQILENYKGFVWKEIENYLKGIIYPPNFTIPANYKADVETSYTIPLKEYPLRQGKYIRPTIVILFAEAMGINKFKALKTAAAMQVSEEFLLIHDDWEDKSIIRRGGPTLHKMFGEEIAINAGDGLQNIMWKILLDNYKKLGWKKTYQIANEFHTILSRTIIGQAIEINWAKKNKDNLSDKDWFFIADGKTGYYTMAGPARLGGIIGNADEKQLDLLSKFGIYLGRCFQLVDDILDVTSDFNGLKEKAGDIYEGKKTLILGHLERNANLSDKKKLRDILKKKRVEKSHEEVEWVIKKMKEYKSIDYALAVAKKYRDKSLKVFNKDLKFLKNRGARKKIETLVNFILERNY